MNSNTINHNSKYKKWH